MPKWGVHNIVLAEAIGQLRATGNPAGQAAANAMSNHRHLAMLGSVGPDLFFFAPDYEIVDKLFTLYKNIEEIVDIYDSVIQPLREIKDAVVEPVEDAVETLAPSTVELIRQALNRVRDTASLFQSTIQTGLFAGVITGVNAITDTAGIGRASAEFFEFFIPPLQNNDPVSQWYWFDMLHYRNTGDFGRDLVEIATGPDGTERQRAFAYGYLSHIATDLVGHAFVNQVVGGPYRLHSQRHTVMENFMDTRKVFEYDGTSVNQTLVDKLGMPPGEDEEATLPNAPELHQEIVDLLHEAFLRTYNSQPHPQRVNTSGSNPGFLSKDQIQKTYEIFWLVMHITKKMTVKRPEEPFSGVADVLSEALADVFEEPPTPPDMSGSSACSLGDIFSFGLTSSSRDCYEEFFENVEEWLEYLGEVLQWAVETLLDIIDLLLAALLSLPVMVLLAILYGIQLLMYELYQTVRFILALEGFVTPEPGDIQTSHGRNLTTTGQCPYKPFSYPKFRDKLRSHLVCPPEWYESPRTAADFFPSDFDTIADGFIHDRPFDIRALYDYANSPTSAYTRDNLEARGRKIGNAIDLTAWMIQTAADSDAGEDAKNVAYTNWNLDSDRGYGYKTWEGEVPEDVNDNDGQVRNERFTDEDILI